ncbi:hypothetical protein FW778_03890 [Ginsengibacter hankyongi]|uniref:Uncharacterized protein n=1 Tax=Ginsengibacter hankyongi TaxID=2607284 RepID=A0A5J5IJN3_9BACT|nr:hypothetical protein [Ginsengibacter hankyongi]KAA9041186.1 hypothetical protein FW778_03890 [Ginsengibacter hankyongi]
MKMIKSLLLLFVFTGINLTTSAQQKNDISVKVNAENGNYIISSAGLNWTFGGSVDKPLNNLKSSKGSDAIGAYKSISFKWKSNNNYVGTIRWYTNSPVVIFSLSTPKGAANQSLEAFPHFTSMPASLYHFSYHDVDFSTPEFTLNETSTPWLLFDENKNSCVISPASDFIVAKLTGDGTTNISSGINEEVQQLPSNFIHSTIMVFDKGIHNMWDVWGGALRALYHRQRPSNDADKVLKYYGYWTDNGADYYYNYDTTKGYANTLLLLKKHYDEQGIPLGYMQLDSWWYEKSITDPRGQPTADHKNPRLPSGAWNRYGGLMEYRADPFLFPKGLTSFQQKLGLPLVTHNRWVDPSSPYQKMYKISRYAAIDPAYWKDIMGYIKHSGVICYEQDWLNQIYMQSPKMSSDLSVGNAFTDGMANAAKADGLNMQYCMAMPRHFLQGVKYNNLTTIRTSGDRFEPKKWMPFIFTSQLGYEMGIWPWCDVFKSSEKGNMIVSNLSAGPVGTGDAIGKEDKANIFMTCRNDGVLVKPDAPLLPVDEDYIDMARMDHKPVLAYTYTKHPGATTSYVFAFATAQTTDMQVTFKPADIGMKGNVAIYEPLQNKLQIIAADKIFTDVLPSKKYTYYIIAPVTKTGIAFLGDAGKITSTGKKRIADIITNGKNLQVKVLFAKGESAVTLHGYAGHTVACDRGKASYDNATHLFNLVVDAPATGNSVNINLRIK